ncbi:restriction endonuclease subunit S [Leuconostoc citreum]|uniref:restriction endonuclease subunit S n=1 Tax=Leuconostoc citreum TaxID=33964 RepID=UPI000660FD7C|nr:restriction endonuclease subunit S [Leuconostoc citreum]GEK60387.1 restriction endonuclease subunit S [Leuconostoc citreum]
MSKMTPQIRFQGFTDDWEERKLGDLSQYTFGGGTPKTAVTEYWNGEIPWIQSSDLSSDHLFGVIPKKHITKNAIKNSATKLIPKNSIAIVTRVGVGKLAFMPYEFASSQDFLSLSNLQVDCNFGMYSIYKMLQRELNNIQGTSIKGITKAVLLDKELIMPVEFEEQQKIGSFFKQLDDTIALHQRKLDLLKEQKKGFLQKMFPKNGARVPDLRFSGFADDWEERKLGETKTYFTDGNYGESYPSSQDMSDKENGVPFLRGSDFSNGYLDASNANYISKEKHAVLTSGHIKNDDIVLAVRGSLGTLGYATKYNEGWNINSQLAILRTNKNELLGVFLIQYLLGSSGQKEILSRNTGTALKQLPIKQLKDIPVPIPIIEEQNKIGSFFKQLDDTIALHQRKLNLLTEQKKGFLQKMFVS